ncbi:MAG: CvpA family protein [Clostridiales bacterium]|nr:CvpA family protein [Clostridiales bacterium]
MKFEFGKKPGRTDWQQVVNHWAEQEGQPKKPAKNGELWAFLITLLFALLFFFTALPAINLQAYEFYVYIGIVLMVWTLLRVPLVLRNKWRTAMAGGEGKGVRRMAPLLFPMYLLAALIVIGGLGTLISAPLFRSAAYRELLEVGTGEFTQDVSQISYDKIPLLDRASAQKLGDRKLGELADMVSQFEVSDLYTQINYRGRPVRVTPLLYGDPFKWFNNRQQGLPAYLIIDMISQEVDVVRLTDYGQSKADIDAGGGMLYSESEPFFRNVRRALRIRYPTFMFEQITFELDEQGIPYWVASRSVRRIGLFGGTDITGVVLLNAVTGEHRYIEAGEVPRWVDNVYSPLLLMHQFDYYGRYRNGFWNAQFGQRDVVMTTEGYNYIAMNDDVYMYTGVTSVGRDESNTGFILSNQRTKETKYYLIPGAEEYSAQDSAEGIVQHLGYKATFPLLLNIGNQPTYVLALKDNAELVKNYAMVNYSRYNLVANGASIYECERNYLKLLQENGLYESDLPLPEETPEAELEQAVAAGVIEEIRTAVIEGTSRYFLRLSGDAHIFVVSAARNPYVVLLEPGTEVELRYLLPEGDAGEGMVEVVSVETVSG